MGQPFSNNQWLTFDPNGIKQLVVNIKEWNAQMMESLPVLRNMSVAKAGDLLNCGYIMDYEKARAVLSSHVGMPVENRPSWLVRD